LSTYKRIVLFALSDIHSGFEQGLCSPETLLRDASTGQEIQVELNNAQKVLWEIYTKAIEEISILAGKDEIFVLSVGDITHGNKHIGEQVSTRMSDQVAMAFYNFRYLFDKLGKRIRRCRMDIGTAAHNFGEGSSDDILSWLLRERYTKIDIKSTYHGLANIDGFRVDYANHGPGPGTRNWLMGNEAKLYLRSMMMSDLDVGDIPASLVLRGHYHTYVKEWCRLVRNGNEYESWITILPSMCLLGDYGKQITKSVYRISPGVVAFEVIGNKLYDTHRYGTELDLRTREDF